MNQHYTGERPIFGRRGASPRRTATAKERLRVLREAAASPQVGEAKFKELLQLEERQSAAEARMAFNRAFSQLQQELPVIGERGVLPFTNGGRGSTYALWEDINEAIRPYLSKYGFGLRFRTSQDGAHVSVTCYLSHHLGGHCEETTVRLPQDLSDGKNGVQAIGSSTSYAKRYAASALLNITSAGEDDDGTAAGRPPCIDPEQLAELRLKLDEVGGDEARLAAYLGVTAIEQLPLARFRQALAALQLKGARK